MRILIQDTINEEEIRLIYRKDVLNEIDIIKFNLESLEELDIKFINYAKKNYDIVYTTKEYFFDWLNHNNVNCILYHND